jgi:trehalose/maltose transport system substrate-binding protein
MNKRVVASAVAFLAAAGAVFVGTRAQDVNLTLACGAVGQELKICKENIAAFTEKTGIKVTPVEGPAFTNDRQAFYQQQLSAGSSDIDVYQIDVVYPGVLANYMIDLKPYISAADLKVQNQGIIANNTVGGKLVAMPWFTDGGVMYYRTDLLNKYKLGVPKTWAQMFAAAKRIQDGERGTNKKFYGFVYQGNAYEGLTCDALEWIASNGGGTIIDAKGNITVNNEAAAKTLDFIAAQSKLVSPPDVTRYGEEEARGVFQSGNAAFMRNWPYAYSLGQGADSVVKGKIGIAPLPSDGKNSSAAALGGWQLSVSKFSKYPKESAQLVAFLASTAIQKERAIKGSFQPTIPTLYSDKEVLAAVPFFKDIKDRKPVARPSTITGTKYPQVSNAFWTAVHSVLTGKAKGAKALADLEAKLKTIKGAGWDKK